MDNQMDDMVIFTSMNMNIEKRKSTHLAPYKYIKYHGHTNIEILLLKSLILEF